MRGERRRVRTSERTSEKRRGDRSPDRSVKGVQGTNATSGKPPLPPPHCHNRHHRHHHCVPYRCHRLRMLTSEMSALVAAVVAASLVTGSTMLVLSLGSTSTVSMASMMDEISCDAPVDALHACVRACVREGAPRRGGRVRHACRMPQATALIVLRWYQFMAGGRRRGLSLDNRCEVSAAYQVHSKRKAANCATRHTPTPALTHTHTFAHTLSRARPGSSGGGDGVDQ
jgi:hypothetical protein